MKTVREVWWHLPWGSTIRHLGVLTLSLRQSSWSMWQLRTESVKDAKGTLVSGAFRITHARFPIFLGQGWDLFILLSEAEALITSKVLHRLPSSWLFPRTTPKSLFGLSQEHPKEVDHIHDWKIYKAIVFLPPLCTYRSMENNKLKWSSLLEPVWRQRDMQAYPLSLKRPSTDMS